MLLERAQSATENIIRMRPGVENERNATCLLAQCSGRIGLGVQHEGRRPQNTKSAGNAGGIAAVKNEANTMWTKRQGTNKAMSAMRADMYLCKNPGTLEKRKHERHNQVAQSSLLHTSENLELSEGAGRHVAWL